MEIYIIRGIIIFSDNNYRDIAYFLSKEKAKKILKELNDEVNELKEKYGDCYEDELSHDYCNYVIKTVKIKD